MGNTTDCPECGATARIIEGAFDIDPGPPTRITQVAGPPVDPELFTRLGLILLQAQAEGLKPHDIVEKIGPHSPSLARRLSRVADDPVAFATVMAALIAGFAVITVALITTGQAPPTVINNTHIHVHPSEGETSRRRDQLHELRRRKTPVPSWVRDYVEPQES